MAALFSRGGDYVISTTSGDTTNVAALSKMLLDVPEILEAHLPQVYAKGVFDPPAQVLAIVVSSHSQGEIAANRIGEWFRGSFAAESHLDIWPLEPHEPMLSTIRGTNTEVKARKRRWWRFWAI